jgi:tRNA G10  N-methylase Trm11
VRTVLRLDHEFEFDLPDRFDGDPRTPATYVEEFLSAYTDPGDTVLDPFAGFGTTLRVAERMDRVAYGVEYDPEVAAVAREHVAHPDRLVEGDALEAASYEDVPPVDCCLTSPPYMVESMAADPLQNYAETGREYGRYLADLGRVFGHVEALLADGHVLVDVSNVTFDGTVTTLAWDLADELEERFRFRGEVVVAWTGGDSRDHGEGAYGYGYDHSYCLVFDRGEETTDRPSARE